MANKSLDSRLMNEFLLSAELSKIKIRNRKDETRNRIKKGAYIGIGVSAFIGGYILFSQYPEYVNQIKDVVINTLNNYNY